MTFGQAKEDLWILQQFPPGFVGYAADVGAYDGVTHSNTLLLELNRWTVLCIEPNPAIIPKLKAKRAFVEVCACDAEPQEVAALSVHVQNMECYTSLRPITDHPTWHPEPGDTFIKVKTKVKTLNDCLDKWEFPRLDVLSIDVEGTELDVLKGADLIRWTPKVVVVESWDEETPVTPYLAEFGYHKVNRLLVNNCYVRSA